MSDKAKSCLSCVFATRSGETDVLALDALGKAVSDTVVCTKFSTVLAFDLDDADDEALSAVAGACDHYADDNYFGERTVDERAPGALGGFGRHGAPLRIAYPEQTEPSVPAQQGGGPQSCYGCAHFVHPQELAHMDVPVPDSAATDEPEGEQKVGYCSARGVLLDLSSPGEDFAVAAKCEVKAPAHEPLGDERLLLESARPLRHLETVLAGALGSTPEAEEADEGPADGADEDLPEGAVAWETFHNDDGTKSVRLPRFDPDHFDDFEQAKIPVDGSEGSPELYVDHANLAYRVAVAWHLGETPAIHGAAGVGKTQLFQWMAYRLGLPFERVSITASSSVDDLAGYMELRGKETVFELGRIPKAWAKPCVMVLDEPNAGPPEVWQFIRPLTDSAKQLVIDSNHGQVVARHDNSYLGMAMNPAWDHRNTGVASLADADGSRLLHILLGYPDAKVERQIITAHCRDAGVTLDQSHLDALIEVAATLRKLSDEGTLQVSWGIRQQVKVARLLPYVEFAEAFRLAAADSLEPEQQRLIIDEVNVATANLGNRRRRKRSTRHLLLAADGTQVVFPSDDLGPIWSQS